MDEFIIVAGAGNDTASFCALEVEALFLDTKFIGFIFKLV